MNKICHSYSDKEESKFLSYVSGNLFKFLYALIIINACF